MLESDDFHPYRWLRRIAVGSVAFIALLAIARLIVGHVAERRWHATETRLRAADVALELVELKYAPLADAENAAWYLTRAASSISNEDGGPRASNYTSLEFGTTPPYTPLWHQLADASEQANERSFRLAREARRVDRADWNIAYGRPGLSILLPHLNNARALANMLVDGAERSFIRNEPAEGVQRLRDALHLADLSADRPFLVTGLVSVGIDAMIVDACAKHVAALRIGPGEGEVTPRAVSALIDDLLREDRREGTPDALVSRVARTTATATIDAGAALEEALWVTRPIVIADRARHGERQLAILDALTASTAGERAARFSAIPPLKRPWTAISFWKSPSNAVPVRMSRPVTHTAGDDLPSLGIVLLGRGAVQRDAVAIMLAMRLYERDHNDQWPATLDALVPNYLSNLPRDKSTDDDGPYGYQLSPHGLPDGRDRPLLTQRASGSGSIDLTNALPPPTTVPSAQGVEQ